MKNLYAFIITCGACLVSVTSLLAQPNLYGLMPRGATTATGGGTILNYKPSTNIANTVKTFDIPAASPSTGSAFIQATDGKLYGIANSGGNLGFGSIISYDPSSDTYSKVYDFDNTNGAYPLGALFQASDGNLYGATTYGGSNNLGVVFSFNISTKVFSVLHNFTGSDGSRPTGLLVQGNDGKLYGMTRLGGSSSKGTIFSISTGGSFSLLHSFKSDGSEGYYPYGGVIQASDGNFYGITSDGDGTTNNGTIFTITSDGTFSLLHLFTGSDGALATGNLVEGTPGNFYGMTEYTEGDNIGYGTIFSITSAGVFSVMHTFQGDEGGNATGSLIIANGRLYGVSSMAFAPVNAGNIFSLSISDPNDFTVLHAFAVSDGWDPEGALLQAGDGRLYGTTQFGGVDASNFSSGSGVIFSIQTSGDEFSVVRHMALTSAVGYDPSGKLLEANNGLLYGTAYYGGTHSFGNVFSYDPSNNNFSVLYNFGDQGGDGQNPPSSLIQASDGKLYGVCYTSSGDYNYAGSLYSITTSGTYSLVHQFNGDDGRNPLAGPVESTVTHKLYGTTQTGGPSSAGTIYSYDPATSSFSSVYNFDFGAHGGIPYGTLTEVSGKLYGTAYAGGTNIDGIIFSFDPQTNDFSVVYNFDGASGQHPAGSLIYAGNLLYGTVSAGGTTGDGVMFSFDPVTNNFTLLHNFGGGGDGREPFGELKQAIDGNLYGLTYQGGNQGEGTIFTYNPTTNTYSKIRDLDDNTGNFPENDVALIDIEHHLITTSDPSPGAYCAGTSLSVPFTIKGNFNNGNIFTAQLSNSSGNFDPSPPVLGTLTSTSAGTINGTIPANTPAGTHYRVRVVSSDPVINGIPNKTDISINAASVAGTINGAANICAGINNLSIGLTLTGYTGSIQWQSAPDDVPGDFSNIGGATGSNYTASNLNATTYYRVVVTNQNCASAVSQSVAINVTQPTTYYQDADHDGFGNPAVSMQACSQPAGYVTDNTDCDDTNGQVWQSGLVYIDQDGDGYDKGQTTICYGTAVPAGYSTTSKGTDCDDLNGAYHSQYPFYPDNDGDGYGGSYSQVNVCAKDANTPPAGYSLNNTDCDDGNNQVWQNSLVYIDHDGDGYDNGQATVCYGASLPAGYSFTTKGHDSDDTNGGVSQTISVYIDKDGDGYDNGQTTINTSSGSIPHGYSLTTRGTDCNDNNASVHASPKPGTISGVGSICLGSCTTLTLKGNDKGTTVQWQSSPDNDPAHFSNINKATGTTYTTPNIAATAYYRVVVSSGGCGAITPVFAENVIPLPVVAPIVASTTALCIGSTLTLTDPTAGGSWSSSNSQTVSVTGGGVIKALKSGSAVISYKVTNANGCVGSASVTINVAQQITLSPIKGSTDICIGQSITLSDASAGGAWASTNTTVASITSSGVVTGLAAGTTTITYTKIVSGCSASISSCTIKVSTLPTVAAITGSHTVAAGSKTTLSDNTPKGSWSSGNTGIASVNSSGVVTGVSVGGCTIYYKVTNASGCQASASFALNITAALKASLSAGKILCNGGTTILTVNASGGSGSYNYSINGGKYQPSNTFTVSAGSYTVSVKDAVSGQTLSYSINISQPATLKLSLNTKANTSGGLSNGSFTVSASGGASPYQYSTNGTTYQSSAIFKNMAAGTYNVSVKDANNCVSLNCLSVSISGSIKKNDITDAAQITINEQAPAVAKTSSETITLDARISPNPSGSNFTLTVSSNIDQTIQIRVINILGQSAYQASGSGNGIYLFGDRFAQGVYFVQVFHKTGVKVIKVMKQ